jgi:hypothetical protein
VKEGNHEIQTREQRSASDPCHDHAPLPSARAEFLDRHVNGDWGEVPEADKQANEVSVEHGLRILSAYTTSAGDQIWILTEADRSATTILLPSEY